MVKYRFAKRKPSGWWGTVLWSEYGAANPVALVDRANADEYRIRKRCRKKWGKVWKLKMEATGLNIK